MQFLTFEISESRNSPLNKSRQDHLSVRLRSCTQTARIADKRSAVHTLLPVKGRKRIECLDPLTDVGTQTSFPASSNNAHSPFPAHATLSIHLQRNYAPNPLRQATNQKNQSAEFQRETIVDLTRTEPRKTLPPPRRRNLHRSISESIFETVRTNVSSSIEQPGH